MSSYSYELETMKRSINLADYVAAQGYELDRRESSRASLVMRHQIEGKIVVATAEDGHGVYFSIGNTKDSGSILDFVMNHKGCSLGHARQELRSWLAGFPFPTAHKPLPKPIPIPRDQAQTVAAWHRLAPYSGGCLESRGLTKATLATFVANIRTDERGNVALRHTDQKGVTGWELKNRSFTGFASGGRKAVFAQRVGEAVRQVVIAESAIDVMSYAQLHGEDGTLYLSIGGSMSHEQQDLLRIILTETHPTARVLIATDADEQGEHYAALIASLRPDSERAAPTLAKDWNDVLRASQGAGRRAAVQLPAVQGELPLAL
jgi:hypothetical protein